MKKFTKTIPNNSFQEVFIAHHLRLEERFSSLLYHLHLWLGYGLLEVSHCAQLCHYRPRIEPRELFPEWGHIECEHRPPGLSMGRVSVIADGKCKR